MSARIKRKPWDLFELDAALRLKAFSALCRTLESILAHKKREGKFYLRLVDYRFLSSSMVAIAIAIIIATPTPIMQGMLSVGCSVSVIGGVSGASFTVR